MISAWIIGGIVLAVALIIFFLAAYTKAAPDEAIIISGLRSKPKVLIGRAGIRIPFIERKDIISLKLMTITLNKTDPIPTQDYIKVTVDAVVTAKVSDSEDDLKAAAQNFLNMQVTGDKNGVRKSPGITDMIDNILDGSLREIIGQTNLEDLVRSRDKITVKVKDSAEKDLRKLGIILETFNIQKFEDTVTDSNGIKHSMIESLGAEKTAAILRDSAISRAKSESETDIAKAEAKKRTNDAQVKADLEIAEKQNELAVKKAGLQKIADTQQAIADAAYEIQKNEQLKTINESAAEAEVVKQEKEIQIRDRLVSVTEKELQASTVKKAEAEKSAAIALADAEFYKQKMAAEAKLYTERQNAEATVARANADKEAKLAEAIGVEAMGNAEAEAVKAKGIAEATALQKKADAYKEFGDAAVTQMKLDTAKDYFKQLPLMAAEMSKSLARIGNVTIFGKGNVADFAGEGINFLSQISSVAKETLGFDLKQICTGLVGAKAVSSLTSKADKAEKVPCEDVQETTQEPATTKVNHELVELAKAAMNPPEKKDEKPEPSKLAKLIDRQKKSRQ